MHAETISNDELTYMSLLSNMGVVYSYRAEDDIGNKNFDLRLRGGWVYVCVCCGWDTVDHLLNLWRIFPVMRVECFVKPFLPPSLPSRSSSYTCYLHPLLHPCSNQTNMDNNAPITYHPPCHCLWTVHLPTWTESTLAEPGGGETPEEAKPPHQRSQPRPSPATRAGTLSVFSKSAWGACLRAVYYQKTYLELSDDGDPSSGDDKFPRGGDIYICCCCHGDDEWSARVRGRVSSGPWRDTAAPMTHNLQARG